VIGLRPSSSVGGAAGLVALSVLPLSAQVMPQPSVDQMDLQLRTIRDYGQPVIPAFEGWYENPDGTFDLCFGFFNLNRLESLDIPLGPDNFIEPVRYDGLQPTHFSALGPRTAPGARGMQREYCVFTVNVPADIGEERVWWNLRIDGRTYRVPGHVTVRPYMIDNLTNSVESAMEEFEENRSYAGAYVAPVVRFARPDGPAGRGKGGVRSGPVEARVGTPLSVTVAISLPDLAETGLGNEELQDEDVLRQQSVKWTEFSGPQGAVVTFEPAAARVGVPTEHATTVQFSEPGSYVLLVQVLNGNFSSQCCWTNAYLEVRVLP